MIAHGAHQQGFYGTEPGCDQHSKTLQFKTNDLLLSNDNETQEIYETSIFCHTLYYTWHNNTR